MVEVGPWFVPFRRRRVELRGRLPLDTWTNTRKISHSVSRMGSHGPKETIHNIIPLRGNDNTHRSKHVRVKRYYKETYG